MKLYIIGMPGSGKTYLGRQLAQSLRLRFADLDEMIEKQTHHTIRTYIEANGESAFRILERETLRSTASLNNIVISCGGGTPVFFDNMEWMKKQGTVIWLNTPIEIISERIAKNITRRPLFMGLSRDEINEKLNKIFAQRQIFYRKANFFVDGHNATRPSLSTVIQQIIKNSKKINH